MAKIRGHKEHSARLARLASREMDDAVYRGLYAGGQIIEIEAEISITAGSISGKDHVPSRPGEPPNADTRLLDTSIETTGQRAAMKVRVTSNAPYSRSLEEGTSKMAARPFMGPAARKKRAEVVELVQRNISRAVRKGA